MDNECHYGLRLGYFGSRLFKFGLDSCALERDPLNSFKPGSAVALFIRIISVANFKVHSLPERN